MRHTVGLPATRVVGIGASAGGIDALIRLVRWAALGAGPRDRRDVVVMPPGDEIEEGALEAPEETGERGPHAVDLQAEEAE